MGLRDGVAKQILTQLIIKGALGCKTLAEWWFLRVLGVDGMGAFLKECQVAFLPFSPRFDEKIFEGCPYGCKGCCCKNDFNTTI